MTSSAPATPAAEPDALARLSEGAEVLDPLAVHEGMGRKDGKWSLGLVAEWRAVLRGELAGLGAVEVLERALDPGLATPAAARDPQVAFRRFEYALCALERHAARGGLSAAQVDAVARLADGILAQQHVRPAVSRLAFLHQDLRWALSRIRRRDGDAWGAVTAAQIGEQQARGAGLERASLGLLVMASRALALGQVGLALTALDGVNGADLSRDNADLATATRAVALRLAGRRGEAHALIDAALAGECGERLRLELEWERLCLAACDSGRADRLLLATSRQLPHARFGFAAEAVLWALACPHSPSEALRLPSCRTLRTRFRDEIDAHPRNRSLFGILQAFEDAADAERPLSARLELVGEALAAAGSDGRLTVDRRLLVALAAARFLTRHNQPAFAAHALAEYDGWSRRIAADGRHDALGLAQDLYARIMAPRIAQAEYLTSVETGLAARTISIGRASKGLAKAVVRARIREMAGRAAPGTGLTPVETAELADLFHAVAGGLKGPLMKIGQMIDFLPGLPETVRERLRQLQVASPPVHHEVMERTLEASLGRRIGEVFARFDREPLCAASIGQVHRATLKDGAEVVVKIQYPGMARAVANDLRLLRLFHPVLRRIWPSVDHLLLHEELTVRLLEECDFRIEAANIAEFRALYAGDPSIVIPTVHEQWTRPDVIVLERMHGRRYAEVVNDPDEGLRGAAAETIFRVAMGSVFQHGLFNADPHPGNYLFLDDKVVFLDFGSVKHWGPEFLTPWRAMAQSALTGDRAAFDTAFTAMGYVADPARFDYEWQWRAFNDTIFAPFHLDEPTLLDGGGNGVTFEELLVAGPNQRSVRLPRDLLLGLRLSFGMHQVVAGLRAKRNWRRMLIDLLSGAYSKY